MLGSKLSNSPENVCFAVSFMYLDLRRECKQDDMRVRESKARVGLQTSADRILSHFRRRGERGHFTRVSPGCTETVDRAYLRQRQAS